MKTLKCENCKAEIVYLKEDDFGLEIDWNTRWEQYLCDVCYDKIWKTLLDNACGICETEPCKKGRDCWVNPWPRIMYLCYVAPRVKMINETKWTKPRKKLCIAFWDDCAQNSCKEPCSRIIAAEKDPESDPHTAHIKILVVD